MKKSLVILILTLIGGFAPVQQAGYKQTNLDQYGGHRQ